MTVETARMDMRNFALSYWQDRLMFSSCQSSLNANWVVSCNLAARQALASRVAEVTARQALNLTPLWRSNLPMEGIHKTTRAITVVALTAVQFGDTVQDIADFDLACATAYDALNARFNALTTEAEIRAVDIENYPGTVSAAWPFFLEL